MHHDKKTKQKHIWDHETKASYLLNEVFLPVPVDQTSVRALEHKREGGVLDIGLAGGNRRGIQSKTTTQLENHVEAAFVGGFADNLFPPPILQEALSGQFATPTHGICNAL